MNEWYDLINILERLRLEIFEKSQLPEDLANMPRDNLQKLFSADLVPGTSRKSIVKKKEQ